MDADFRERCGKTERAFCSPVPNIFSFPPGAAAFLFDVSKRKVGAHGMHRRSAGSLR
jgi:hypothetical protein